MTVITQNKIGLKKSYTLAPKQIKLTGRNCKGLNLHNLLKIPKSEIIVEVKWSEQLSSSLIYNKYNK